ncbi:MULTISPECIES: hypothetical protein [unclassified Microcoleus]|uniref:hypothetical protein n=1 Tax=unclassified Microcoleus TaxID=2642155 RepID=UPI002FD28691
MLKTIKVTSATGNQQHILKLFKEYVIDFLKKAVAVAEENGQRFLPQFYNSDWQWVTDSSPAELLETVSWAWHSRCATRPQATNGNGTDGDCTIYLKSEQAIRSHTTERLLEGNAVYDLDITVTS